MEENQFNTQMEQENAAAAAAGNPNPDQNEQQLSAIEKQSSNMFNGGSGPPNQQF